MADAATSTQDPLSGDVEGAGVTVERQARMRRREAPVAADRLLGVALLVFGAATSAYCLSRPWGRTLISGVALGPGLFPLLAAGSITLLGAALTILPPARGIVGGYGAVPPDATESNHGDATTPAHAGHQVALIAAVTVLYSVMFVQAYVYATVAYTLVVSVLWGAALRRAFVFAVLYSVALYALLGGLLDWPISPGW